MSFFERALGVELTPSGWRAVLLEARLFRTRVVGVAEGASDAGLRSHAGSALEEATAALQVGAGTRLGVALARPTAHVKRMALPRESRAIVLKAVRAQAPSIFPVGKQVVIADVRVGGRSGQRGARATEGLVAAAPKALLEGLAATAPRLGLRFRSADLSASAVRLLLPRTARSAVLVHGAGIESLRYTRRGGLEASRYHPFGTDGRVAPGEVPTEPGGLPEFVRQDIDGDQAVLLTSRSALGVREPVQDHENRAQGDSRVAIRRVAGLDHLRFAAACGAALQALGAPTLFDLRPDGFRRGAMTTRRRRRLLLLGLLVAAVSLTGLGSFLGLQSEVARLERAAAELRPQAEQVVEVREVIRDASRRANLLVELERTQPRWTQVLVELARALPVHACLSALRVDGGALRLEGYAAATSAVVGALELSAMFDSVRMAGPVTRERTPVGERERFALTVAVTGGRARP